MHRRWGGRIWVESGKQYCYNHKHQVCRQLKDIVRNFKHIFNRNFCKNCPKLSTPNGGKWQCYFFEYPIDFTDPMYIGTYCNFECLDGSVFTLNGQDFTQYRVDCMDNLSWISVGPPSWNVYFKNINFRMKPIKPMIQKSWNAMFGCALPLTLVVRDGSALMEDMLVVHVAWYVQMRKLVSK